jgi:hypothetical protein
MGEFSLGIDSNFRTDTTGKSRAKQALNPDSNAETIERVVEPSGGFVAPPLITHSAGEQYADFYRNGSPDLQPRSMDPFYLEDTPASIRIRGVPDGSSVETDLIPAYTKFLLQNVNEAHVERSQVVETFGQFYAFFFGERPSTYTYSGTLINSKNANWVADWQFFYENYLRGTRAAEQKAVVLLTYGGRQVEGFIMNTSSTTNAMTEEGVQFQFQLLVTRRRVVGLSDDFGLFTQSGRLITDENLVGVLNTIAGVEGKGSSENSVSNAINEGKEVMAGGSDPVTFGSFA